MVDKIQIDLAVLKKFQPFEQLSDSELSKLQASIKKNALPPGKLLFKATENDQQAIFLLSGEVELLSGRSVVDVIKASTPEAKVPLANVQPRQYSARAKTSITLFWLEASMLRDISSGTKKVDYDVSELDTSESDDWMVSLLQRPIFQEIPADNIQKIMTRFEPIAVAKGDQIIQQGDEGDYYYFIQTGQCSVLRLDEKTNKKIKLAVLKDGDVFGEESLVSGSKRSTSVQMLTDGTLLRLSKADFVELITNPMLDLVAYPAAVALIEGGAHWLDIRAPEQHKKNGLPDSINIPHYILRHQITKLEESGHYVAYCDNGQQSASSAFLAQERGYVLSVLKGGLDGIKVDKGEKKQPKAEVIETKPATAVPIAHDEAATRALKTARAAAERAVRDKLSMQNALEALQAKQGDTEQEYLDKITGLEQEMVETRKDHEREFYTWQKERDLFKSQTDTVMANCDSAKNAEVLALKQVEQSQQALDALQQTSTEQMAVLNQTIADLETEMGLARDAVTLAGEDQTAHLLKQEIEALEARLAELGDIQTDEQLLATVKKLEASEKLSKQQQQQDAAALQSAREQMAEKAAAVDSELCDAAEAQQQLQAQVAAQKQAQDDAHALQVAVEARAQASDLENTQLKQQLSDQAVNLESLTAVEQAQVADIQVLTDAKIAVDEALAQSVADAEATQHEVAQLQTDQAALTEQLGTLAEAERALKIAEEAAHEAASHTRDLTEKVALLEQTGEASSAEIVKLQALTQVSEVEGKLSSAQSKLMRLAKEKQQLQATHDALDVRMQACEAETVQQRTEHEQLLRTLEQEKQALNAQLLAASRELEQAREQQASQPDSADMRTALADMMPDEMTALQKELDLVRAHSAEELKAIIAQRDQWEKKFIQEHQRAESYQEECQKVDHSKADVFEQNQQLDRSVYQIQDAYKKLKIVSEENDAELMLEREETGRLSQELSSAQATVRELTEAKTQVEATGFEHQHKMVELQKRLDAQPRGVSLPGLAEGRKKQNSKAFLFFVGIMVGFLFVVFVQFLTGEKTLFSRLSTTFSGIMGTSESQGKTPDETKAAPKALDEKASQTFFRPTLGRATQGLEVINFSSGKHRLDQHDGV